MNLLLRFMNLFSAPSMQALLIRQRLTLDRIFGEQAYEITSSHRQQATIRSRDVDVSFGHERDGEIGALIELRDPPAEGAGTAQTWLWGMFLGIDMSPLERDRDGRVLMPPEQQLELELAVISRLMAEVFPDPQKLSAAVSFIEERTREYNNQFNRTGVDDDANQA